MDKHKIEIPKNITPDEFFLRFVPNTFRENSAGTDMSEYKDFSLDVQVNVGGTGGGTYGLKLLKGAEIATSSGPLVNPMLNCTFDRRTFDRAVAEEFPWLPLDILLDPGALRERLAPAQATEEMDLLRGIQGQTDLRVVTKSGDTVGLRVNFQGSTEPAVIFHATDRIAEEISSEKYTVMEAFMASKLKIEGPVEFAMHVMALAPDSEDE